MSDEENVPMTIVKLSAAQRAERATQLADAVDAQLLHQEKAKETRAKLLRKKRELDAEVDRLHKCVLNGTEEVPAQDELPGIEKPKRKGRVRLVDENPTGDEDADPDMKN